MVRVDSAGPSTGGILLSPDKRRLVWDIGQFVGMCWSLVTLRAIGFSYATLKPALSCSHMQHRRNQLLARIFFSWDNHVISLIKFPQTQIQNYI